MCRGGCGHDNHEIHAIFRLTHGCLQQRKLIRNKQKLLLGIFDFPLISGNYQQTNENINFLSWLVVFALPELKGRDHREPAVLWEGDGWPAAFRSPAWADAPATPAQITQIIKLAHCSRHFDQYRYDLLLNFSISVPISRLDFNQLQLRGKNYKLQLWGTNIQLRSSKKCSAPRKKNRLRLGLQMKFCFDAIAIFF